MQPEERALVLEHSQEIENAYAAASLSGDSSVPTNAEEEVDYHFICFAKSHKSDRVYELDGDRKGPIGRGFTTDNMLSEEVLAMIKAYMRLEEDAHHAGFGLMALLHL